MPLSPPLVLEAGSNTKFQLLPLFNIVGPPFGSNKELGGTSFLVLKEVKLSTHLLIWNNIMCGDTCYVPKSYV
jgi:hypothetical protein